MKKYEEAELMVVRVDNAVICTSGCSCPQYIKHNDYFDPETDEVIV